jgi:signal transduction histidine kinase
MVDRIACASGTPADPLTLRRARMIAAFSMIVLPFPIAAALIHLFVDAHGATSTLAVAVSGLVGLSVALLLVRRGQIEIAGRLGGLLALVNIAVSVWQTGGVRGATLVWLPIVPMVAVIFGGRAVGTIGVLASLGTIAGFYWADSAGWAPPAAGDANSALSYGINVSFVAILLFLFARLYERESERAVQELARIGQLAQAASLAKSAFLANTSHEIRTPLTAIAGYADLLLDDLDAPVERARRQEMVETIRRNADHLKRVLGDVLDLSRIEAGRVELELGRVALHDLLRDVAQLMSVQADLKGLELELELEAGTPQEVETDATRLRQVLVNLLGNAIRFTERGSISLRARGVEEQRFAIEVVDTGAGMTAEQLAKVFQPFVQGDSSTTRTHGGTGLGLTISRALVELMGGTLEARSEPQRGSSFRVELPVGRPWEAPVLTPAPASEGPLRPRAGIRVLVAEDGPDNQRLIRTLLERLQCRVEIVPHGEAALDRALWDAKSFDIVLLDMQMPLLDGYQTARELRRRGVEIPIVALTAHALSDERARCLAAGCTDYLSKPIDRAALASCIARLT